MGIAGLAKAFNGGALGPVLDAFVPNKPAPTAAKSNTTSTPVAKPAPMSFESAPKMHNGGPVLRDGVYQLKKGEHVLTEPEARKAKKHALMASGMTSLSKVVPVPPSRKGATSGEPKVVVKPEKKATASIKVRPEKNQATQVKPQIGK